MRDRCPRCHSHRVYNYGDSVPTNKGYITHYKCRDCDYFFTDKEMRDEYEARNINK